jgi:hypothetical protein
MIPLPPGLLAALRDRDEVLVSSRAGTRRGTVRMAFAVAPPGVVYLLTSAFSRKVRRWEGDPWVRLAVPGTEVFAEGTARKVGTAVLDLAARQAILERFTAAGAATPEALEQLLETGAHLLFRVEGMVPGSAS